MTAAEARTLRRTLRAASFAPSFAAPSGPSTFIVPSAIAPMPDRSGRYVLRRRESATFFTASGLSFSLLSASGHDAPTAAWALRCDLVGAREGALVTDSQLQARVHTYVGTSAVTDTPTYDRLAWEEVYPGVDMVAEPARGGVAYRFVLSPGAKVSDVVMRWEGATAVRAVDDGRGVDVETGIGVLRVRGLRAFAVEGEQRTELPARHVVRGQDVGVEVDGWDGRGSLVIDPTIGWSSYLGGSAGEALYAAAVDGTGNVWVSGNSLSDDFPMTTGALDTSRNGWDAVVSKVSSTGALLWSSYLGGTGTEYGGDAIAVDSAGNAIVGGATTSSDFPTTTGAYDTSLYGTNDAFVLKLNSSGTLAWSTYLGGGGTESVQAIAVDSTGAVLVAGNTYSPNFPTTTGAHDTTLGGTNDGFVAKLNAAGTTLVWSTYLGGAQGDFPSTIAVDSGGNAFVVGSTDSTAFPSTGGFDTTLSGTNDGFVTKFSSAGALLWSSYLGGGATDSASGVAVDASGNAFVVGSTTSTDFPTTGGFDTTFGGGGVLDAFVTKISGAGLVQWSSYLGGAAQDNAMGVALDKAGNVFIVGNTLSSDFPSTSGFDTSLGGTQDVFVTKVMASGTLLWSSYLGGSGSDNAYAAASDGAGNLFVVGSTQSTDFPRGSGGFDATIGGTSDGFITKITGSALGAACTNATQCLSSLCVDGICCDTPCTGLCQACSAAKKGTGTSGTCGPITDGTNPDNECTPQSCTAGVVTKSQVCNGAGACRGDGTIACSPYMCAGTACATTCSSDSGCAATAHCAGTTCTPDLEIGAACSRASQCKSGFCADGVCCDKACAGACEACTAVKKGSGTDGTCAAVAADTDPKNACPVGTGACAEDGLCDGAGNCRPFAKPGAACGATTCTGGVVSGRVCKGDSATCIDSTGVTCAPYGCGTAACKTSCTADSDCDATAFCTSTGACVPKASNGTACTNGRECTSGLCADGVCCNTLCAGQCESCNETGAAGTCTPILGNPRGARTACDALSDTDCAKTTCDGTVRDKCAGYKNGTTTPCGMAACTADKKYQKAGACDGRGACAMPEPQNCTPYVCDLAVSTGCKSSCASDGDCAEGFTCSEGACIQGAKCNADKTASIDKTGNETPCALYRCGTDGKCLTTCTATDQCSPGSVCDPSSKTCVAQTDPANTSDEGGCSYGASGRTTGSLAMLMVALVALGRRRAARR